MNRRTCDSRLARSKSDVVDRDVIQSLMVGSGRAHFDCAGGAQHCGGLANARECGVRDDHRAQCVDAVSDAWLLCKGLYEYLLARFRDSAGARARARA